MDIHQDDQKAQDGAHNAIFAPSSRLEAWELTVSSDFGLIRYDIA